MTAHTRKPVPLIRRPRWWWRIGLPLLLFVALADPLLTWVRPQVVAGLYRAAAALGWLSDLAAGGYTAPDQGRRIPLDIAALTLGVGPALWIALRLYHVLSDNRGTRCGRCGNVLRGLREPRCPACGEAL
jgi:hypothetical protein